MAITSGCPAAKRDRSIRHMARNPEPAGRLDAALDVIDERSTHLKELLEGYARFARLPAPVLGIPSESGHPFRREGGHHSDVKAATHSDVKAATIPT